MTTLAALKTILQSEVPAVGSVPTSAQYEQAIKDAVMEFSRRCGLVKLADLSIVANTAPYSLPDDFQKLIWLEALTGVDGVIISDAGLIPLGAEFNEEYSIINRQITFKPVPGYTMTREYKYKAGWVLTGGTDYTTLGDAEQNVVMIKAKQLTKEKIKNSMAGGDMKYSFGAVSVDKTGGLEDLTREIFALHGEFVQACDSYNGNASGAF